MENRAGKLVTNLYGELAYKSFLPADLPPSPGLEISNGLLAKLTDACGKLSVLEAVSSRIPSIELFVSMYVRKESLLSSQIEGTQCTLDDILYPNIESNANLNVTEVINYVRATEYAIKRMESLPLCNRLLKETHAVLMEGVRGQEKSPGEFRTSQNWIGGQGSTIKTARYIPPNVEDMQTCMSALEKFINAPDDMNPVIKAALVHYQFETIHPFLDGNGRLGRLLIVLLLMEKKVLSKPVLYASYFLKENRIEYYDRMMQVRRNGDYEQWISFFLDALSVSANDAIETIDALGSLHEASVKKINEVFAKKTENAVKLLEYLECNPIIDTKKTSLALGLSYNTVSKLVEMFVASGLLKVSGKSGKAKLYCYDAYLEILRKGT